MALGAFVAGVVLGESDLSHQAAAETLPVQQVFTVLFFVSIGMLFDPMSVVRMPLEIAAMLVSIVIGAGLVTVVILLALRCPTETAALVGAAFAQIGEFSFILTELAIEQKLIGAAERDLVLAAALLSIVINALMFRLATDLAPRVAGLPLIRRWREGAEGDHALAPIRMAGHAILVGHGRVGSLVAGALTSHELPFVVIESDRTRAEKLRASGSAVIYGDATREEVLGAASPGVARLLVVALPDAFHARHVITLARKMNPAIETVVRTHSDQEALYLEQEAGVGLVVMGEREVALSMSDFALQRLGVSSADAQATVNRFRQKGEQR
jgi:CPA2 family monovalent cation:H+ antiporter-2